MTFPVRQEKWRDDALGDLRERRCIVTGEVLPEARLVRFAVTPEGRVVPDISAKLPGRGIWVRAERAVIETAVAKRLFAKAARAPLVADAQLPALAEERLVACLQSHLGIARKAGAAILGFDQVEQALRSAKPPGVIVEASDASPEGSRKLRAAALAGGVAPFVLGVLTKAELSLALGRENVVHAAIKSGRIAERLIFDAGRLAGFRPLKPWVWVGFSGGDAGSSG